MYFQLWSNYQIKNLITNIFSIDFVGDGFYNDGFRTDFMRIAHTSPHPINKIHNQGRFGPGLFFANQPYFMTQDEGHIYGLDIPEEEIIDASDLESLDDEDYKKIKHIVKDIMNSLGVSEEKALSLLSESDNLHDLHSRLEDYVNYYDEDEDDEDYIQKKQQYQNLSKHDLAETSWDIQSQALKAANILGKRGIKLLDEQGSSFLINMVGMEHKLKHLSDDKWNSYERYEDEEEEQEKAPHNLKFKY